MKIHCAIVKLASGPLPSKKQSFQRAFDVEKDTLIADRRLKNIIPTLIKNKIFDRNILADKTISAAK